MEQINKKLAAITKLIKAIPTTSNNTKGGRSTTVLHAAGKKMGIKMQQQGQIPWKEVRLANQTTDIEEGQ
eukprot:11454592-Ditylum_brightwellii.AAC.1